MRHERSILGIHIDGEMLSIVHLRHTPGGPSVHSWVAERLDEGTMGEGVVVQAGAVASRIRKFVTTHRIRTYRAAMLLSASAARVRLSEFPGGPADRLRSDVGKQIAQYGLFGKEEMVFDYCTTADAAPLPAKCTVLEAITTRRAGEACLKVARQARLALVGLEPAVLPIMNLIHDRLLTETQAVSLLLTLESTAGNLCVFQNGLPHFCHPLDVGVEDAARDEQGVTRLMHHMRQVLGFARLLAGSRPLALRVVASGSREQWDAIARTIEKTSRDVIVERIDSAQVARQFAVAGVDHEDPPVFALASALTSLGVSRFLGPLNLIPGESSARYRRRDELSLMGKVVTALVLLSVGVTFPLKAWTRRVQAASADLMARAAETMPPEGTVADLTRRIAESEKRRSYYVRATEGLICLPWPFVLQAIGDVVPDEVRLIDFTTTEPAGFTLLGQALAESDVYTFAERLQNTEFIASATVEQVEHDDRNVRMLVTYRMVCTLRSPGRDS